MSKREEEKYVFPDKWTLAFFIIAGTVCCFLLGYAFWIGLPKYTEATITNIQWQASVNKLVWQVVAKPSLKVGQITIPESDQEWVISDTKADMGDISQTVSYPDLPQKPLCDNGKHALGDFCYERTLKYVVTFKTPSGDTISQTIQNSLPNSYKVGVRFSLWAAQTGPYGKSELSNTPQPEN